jgi:hypothetical protein
MSRRNAVLALAAAWVCVFAAAAAAAPIFDPSMFGLRRRPPPPALVFVYRGWHVDASKARRAQAPENTVRAIQAQIDIVERAGLKPQMLAFMRATPLSADPTPRRDAVGYSRARGVEIRVKRLDAKKPAVLSGLLRAYYDQQLATGGAHADIGRFRLQILARHVWPKTAMMLQGDEPFFAATATTYLYGATTREPYTRANLRQTEPGYYQWLAKLFDDGVARR